jgi:hypothetical protein
MGKEQRLLSRLQKDSGKVSEFVKSGTFGLASSQKSFKITVDDPAHAFAETYYVSLYDVENVKKHPSMVAQIVKRIDKEVGQSNE